MVTLFFHNSKNISALTALNINNSNNIQLLIILLKKLCQKNIFSNQKIQQIKVRIVHIKTYITN
jgi:hypothetical protein